MEQSQIKNHSCEFNEQRRKSWIPQYFVESYRDDAVKCLSTLQIKHDFGDRFTIKNIVNAISILFISLLCLQQCYSQLNEYFKFETRNQVSYGQAGESIFSLFPGITVCNNNRLRLDYLVKEGLKMGEEEKKELLEKSYSSSSVAHRMNVTRVSIIF